MKTSILIVTFLLFLNSCGGSASNDISDATDITDVIFTSQVSSCSDYSKSYKSAVKDVGNNLNFYGSLNIKTENGKCIFTTNAIPNHSFNNSTIPAFATDVSTQNDTFSITQSPTFAAGTTTISLTTDNAIFLNGVKLDLLAAACFNVGDGKIGCNDINQPFRFDPMSALNNFGTDEHNAHTQPDGTYHYHGDPNSMFSDSTVVSPVIGFAADGFPIYGSFFNDNGTARKVISSYGLKSGSRSAITYNGTVYDPGGNYNGKFVDDYQYNSGTGDLDECNGMTVNGSYGYYVTDSYPWVLKCFKGEPDSSFDKQS
jgi:hypothetical protein